MRIWKEENNDPRRMFPMGSAGVPAQREHAVGLIPDWVYYVSVCGFTFEFHGVEQIRIALDFYSRNTHRSSRLPSMEPHGEDGRWRGDHECAQRWFERLPLRLQTEKNRQLVVKALQKAIEEFGG